jgi:hypothetical protein
MFLTFLTVILPLALSSSAYSASLNLVVVTNKQTYNVGYTATFTGSVNNGTAFPDAIVLFEVDTQHGTPWIIRTFATGPNPSPPLGGWQVQLLNVTPTDSEGNPVYSFAPGNNAGVSVTVTNNILSPVSPVVVAINVFYSNGLPIWPTQVIFNGTLQADQTVTVTTWPIIIPYGAVVGQAIVCASVFNDYPKNGGLPYSPGQSAAFNITSGVPAQVPSSNPLGSFSLTVPLISMPLMQILLGNYTVYAMTFYQYSIASVTTTFNVQLTGDLNGDGVVDIADVAFIAAVYGAHGPNYPAPGDPASKNWNPRYDLAGINVIDITDIAMVASQFGLYAKYP